MSTLGVWVPENWIAVGNNMMMLALDGKPVIKASKLSDLVSWEVEWRLDRDGGRLNMDEDVGRF